jgi:hypothetical protein
VLRAEERLRRNGYFSDSINPVLSKYSTTNDLKDLLMNELFKANGALCIAA